ncbi:MAG TPA: methyltransferase [Saprospiraceae bacterium]|nr:methyltransferase [Saprospiraceae bacterium]
MPLKPNFLERFLINRGIIPGPLLDVGMSMFQSSALLTAGEIQLFNHLKSPLTLEEIGEKTKCSHQGLQILIECLIHLGYINKKENHYSLSKAMKDSLTIELFPEMVPFFKFQIQKSADSHIAVRDNPPGGIVGWEFVKSGEIGKSYQTTMRWLASNTVDEVVSIIKFDAIPTKMLDIGGSHGLYCVKFCKKFQGLSATVLDWEIGLENARQTLVQEEELADRIDLFQCDFVEEDLPVGYDFVFLGNIIHGLTEEGNQKLFKKIAESTMKQTTIAILDQFTNVKGSSFVKGVASLVGWNLFLFTGGKAYDFNAVKKWLEKCGFSSARLTHLRRSPGFSLLTAHKK